MGLISDIYNREVTTPLETDKYHYPTGYGFWREGRANNQAIFYMFGRKEAQEGGYTVAAGLEAVIDIVKRWQEFGLSQNEIDYLGTLEGGDGRAAFSREFLDYLKNAEFKFKIDAVPEGSVFFPQEPVLRVEGPLTQVKILESVALGEMNGHCAWITQAARLNEVISRKMENGSPTGTASVQGLRRGPGLGAALEASRSLGAGGYASTSTGTAAKLFGQEFAGTMDHAWIMLHRNELGNISLAELYKMEKEGRHKELQEAWTNDAFRSYAMTIPEGGIFLVDTYNPIQGLKNAITVIKEMRELGHGKKYGVRFDSGDIVAYSKIALREFAKEGLVTGLKPEDADKLSDVELLKGYADKCTVFCAAADGIDEYTAQEMREQGCFFQAWGIGTAGSHVDPLGLVHKAAKVVMEVGAPDGAEMTPVMKVASNAPVKSSNPGKINSRRFYDVDGKIARVVIYDEDLGLDPNGKMVNLRNFDEKITLKSNNFSDLLAPVFDAQGNYVYQEPAQKETFPGSGAFTTDVGSIAKKVRHELETLPDECRIIVRPRLENLNRALAKAFTEAKQSGTPMPGVEEIEASLPQQAGHVPVFLDHNLFTQRVACEERHLGHAQGGVGVFKERFGA